MNFTALIFAIMLILGVSSYESKAEAASVNNAKLLIGWYEDRSTPISADNSYRTEILNLIEALDGGTFVGEVKSNDLHSGTGYCLISEEYGEVCVTLIEPVFADEGELMEVTILPQEEPLTRITPIYAEAEKLYK